jgi:hypothetical protein
MFYYYSACLQLGKTKENFSIAGIIQGLPELADQNNTVKSLSSGNNRKNILKNPSSLDFKIRTFLIDQSGVDIKLP